MLRIIALLQSDNLLASVLITYLKLLKIIKKKIVILAFNANLESHYTGSQRSRSKDYAKAYAGNERLWCTEELRLQLKQ